MVAQPIELTRSRLLLQVQCLLKMLTRNRKLQACKDAAANAGRLLHLEQMKSPSEMENQRIECIYKPGHRESHASLKPLISVTHGVHMIHMYVFLNSVEVRDHRYLVGSHLVSGWRPSILGFRLSLPGWRPSLLGWR